MLILPKALEPDDPGLVDDHGAERCVLLVVPYTVGIGHVANRRWYQRKGDAEFLSDAFHIVPVAATAQPDHFAACLMDLSDASLQLPELLSARPSVVRMVKDEYDGRLRSEVVESQDVAVNLLDAEIGRLFSAQCWCTSQCRERETRKEDGASASGGGHMLLSPRNPSV